MGKRKKAAKKPTGPRKNEPLATTFACLFCNHEKSVEIKMDRKAGTGYLSCKVCAQSYQSQVNYLSAPVDVYSDWVDACDAVAKGNADGGALDLTQSRDSGAGGRGLDADENQEGYEGEGIVPDDEYD